MILLIDDIRDIPTVDMIARTSRAAKKALAVGGWTFIMFDHDLGIDQESGYTVLKYGLEVGMGSADIQLVTANPVGRERMKNILLDAGYKTKDGYNFTPPKTS